VTEQGVMALN